MKNFAVILIICLTFSSCSMINKAEIKPDETTDTQTGIVVESDITLEIIETIEESIIEEVNIDEIKEDISKNELNIIDTVEDLIDEVQLEEINETTEEISSQISSELKYENEQESEETFNELFQDIEELFHEIDIQGGEQ